VSLSPDNLMAWCRENMAHYKVPRTVIVTDDLPRNAAGKVSKLHLRTEGGR
jgi:HIP---CoA ligase